MFCVICGDEHNRSHSYCKNCHAENMREWRKSKTLNPTQKFKANCRAYAGVYKRRGRLKSTACAFCGDEATEMHHLDYTKPLQVDWLCRAHHLLLHRLLVP